MKREMIVMMDSAFAENERCVRDEMTRISKTEAPEFGEAFSKIESLNE